MKFSLRPRTSPARRSPPPALHLLLLAALPLVVWALQDSGSTQAAALLMGCLLIAALRLIARGERLHRAYDTAAGARAPRVPRKLIGAVLLGLMVFLLAGFRFDSVALSLGLGAIGTALAMLAFGIDPMVDKHAPRTAPINRATLLSQLENALAEAELRVAELGEHDLAMQTTAFADHTAALLHRAADRDRARLEAMEPVLTHLRDMLDAEVTRLEESDRGPFARRRYADQLTLLQASVGRWVGEAAEAEAEADESFTRLMRTADRLHHTDAA